MIQMRACGFQASQDVHGGLVYCSMRLGVPFIAQRQLGAIGAPFGRQQQPSVRGHTRQSGEFQLQRLWRFLSAASSSRRQPRHRTVSGAPIAGASLAVSAKLLLFLFDFTQLSSWHLSKHVQHKKQMTKCLELTFILDPSRFSSYTFAQHHVSSHIMCCASYHQNNIEMAQGHISLSISPFLVIYANTLKSNSF